MLEWVVFLSIATVILGVIHMFTNTAPKYVSGEEYRVDTRLLATDGTHRRVLLSVDPFGIRILPPYGPSMIFMHPATIEEVNLDHRTVQAGALEGWAVVGLNVVDSVGNEFSLIEEGPGAVRKLETIRSAILSAKRDAEASPSGAKFA